ncbi:UNVERIFIED_CONTAM: hypothetical protein HDU68_010056 [Siphonaria sp. JEL0065]|nr:hypothetical protein HDU68_010056 [Siphonaria sp. JEL0065]
MNILHLERRGGPATSTGGISKQPNVTRAASTSTALKSTGSTIRTVLNDGTGIPVAIPQPETTGKTTIKVIRTLPSSTLTSSATLVIPTTATIRTFTTGTGVANQTEAGGLPTSTSIFIILGSILTLLILLVCLVKAGQIYRPKNQYFHRAENLHNRNSSSSEFGSIRNFATGKSLGGSGSRRSTGGSRHSFASDVSATYQSSLPIVPLEHVELVVQRPYDTISIESSEHQKFSPPPAALPSHIVLQHQQCPRLSEAFPQDFYTLPKPPQKSLQRDRDYRNYQLGAISVSGDTNQEMLREAPHGQRYPIHVPSAETVAHAFLMLSDEEGDFKVSKSLGGGGRASDQNQQRLDQHHQHLIVTSSPQSQASWIVPIDGGSGISSDVGYMSPPSVASEGLVTRNELVDMYTCAAGRRGEGVAPVYVDSNVGSASGWGDVVYSSDGVESIGFVGEKVHL